MAVQVDITKRLADIAATSVQTSFATSNNDTQTDNIDRKEVQLQTTAVNNEVKIEY